MEVMERGGGGQGKERDQSLGMIVFGATPNHYDDGKDNAAVRMIMARTMTARKTKVNLTTTTARTTPVFDATTSHNKDGKDNNSKDNNNNNNNNNGINYKSNNNNYNGNDNHRGGSGGGGGEGRGEKRMKNITMFRCIKITLKSIPYD